MGLRFQRRVKLLPGVHLNLSGSGVGVSVGGRGAHIESLPAASATPASDCLAPAFPGGSTKSRRQAARGVICALRATSTSQRGWHWSLC